MSLFRLLVLAVVFLYSVCAQQVTDGNTDTTQDTTIDTTSTSTSTSTSTPTSTLTRTLTSSTTTSSILTQRPTSTITTMTTSQVDPITGGVLTKTTSNEPTPTIDNKNIDKEPQKLEGEEEEEGKNSLTGGIVALIVVCSALLILGIGVLFLRRSMLRPSPGLEAAKAPGFQTRRPISPRHYPLPPSADKPHFPHVPVYFANK